MNIGLAAQAAVPATDLAALKSRQQTIWSSGNYAAIGTTLQIVGEQLCETANLVSGARVLDVAAGNGNATLAAARRFCRVTSTDYVATLVEGARQRSAAEGLAVEFQIADAEALPFENNEFDAVISTFGVMFTPDQERAAAEMARVCRPGGTIAMANWTPEGFIGQMFKIIGRHLPPPAGVQSPMRWGNEPGVRNLFGASAKLVDFGRRNYNFRYCSAEHFLEFFGSYYGPIHKAFITLGDQGAALKSDLRALLDKHNISTSGTLIVPSEYAEVILQKI